MTGTIFVNKQATIPISRDDIQNLYHSVIPILAKDLGVEFLEAAEVELWQYNLFFHNLSAEYFNKAYHLVIRACKEHDNLKCYKDELDKLFQSDPRFKHEL